MSGNIVGKQFTNSTDLNGVTIDYNSFDSAIWGQEEEDMTPEQAQQLKYASDIAAWIQSYAFPTLIAYITATRAEIAAQGTAAIDVDALAKEFTEKSAAALAARLES